MNSMRATVKMNAKRVLRTKYGRAIIMVMLLFGINILFGLLDSIISTAFHMPLFVNAANDMTPSIFRDINISFPLFISNIAITALSFFILTPLTYGVNSWFYRLVGDENCEISTAFAFFESTSLMFKSWGANIIIIIRMLLYTLIFSFPGVFIIGLGKGFTEMESYDHRQFIMGEITMGCGFFLLILAGIFLCIIRNKYLLVKYILASKRNLKVGKAIKLSAQITKGEKAKLFILDLSFIFWFMLCLFIIPILYVFPYYMTSKALYSKVLIERYYEGEMQRENRETTYEEVNSEYDNIIIKENNEQ